MTGLEVFFLLLFLIFLILFFVFLFLYIARNNNILPDTQTLTSFKPVSYSSIVYPSSVPSTSYDISTARLCIASCMSANNGNLNANTFLPANNLSGKFVNQGLLITPVRTGYMPFEAIFAYPDQTVNSNNTLSLNQDAPWMYMTFQNVGNIHQGIGTVSNVAYTDVLNNISGKNNILFTGHGVGAGIAYTCAVALKKKNPSLNIFAYTSSEPLIGDIEWKNNSKLVTHATLENEVDNFPSLVLPGMQNTSFASKNTYAAYVRDVGNRVKFTYNTGSVANNHNLITYAYVLFPDTISKPFTNIWEIQYPVF